MEIQILPSDVVDQIAAGEVVERPAHLVKELIENSLDAGALRVDVESGDGGRRVKVSDDGRGIAAAELPRALERFATSKIRATEDLWKLASFGFRGEALASLAAVSRLTITSRRDGESGAHRLVSEFGRRGPVDAVGGAKGTTVLVEELFGNVPARLKFLKSEAGELGQIRSTVKAMALSRPEVEFRLHENGRLQFFYPAAKSFRERAEQVLDVSPLFEGEAEREGVKAKAVFAAPSDIAKTSRQIWLFAQNRWIQDRGLQAAVTEAYRNLLMHGEYPIAAVQISCDPAEIDVNIHPTKSQVKFRDPSLAFRAVAASIRGTLEKAPWSSFDATPGGRPATLSPESSPSETPAGGDLSSVTQAVLSFSDTALTATVSSKRDFSSFQRESTPRAMGSLPNFAPGAPTPVAPPAPAPEAPLGVWSSLEVLGQADLTYIICQSAKGLVLVDQHAAHERVAFERLMAAWAGGRIDVQEFLFPMAVDLPPDKVEALVAAAPDLARLGISVEGLGPSTIGVKAGPSLLKDGVYASALERTAQELVDRGGSYAFEKIVGDLCATMACHSVVRAGQPLSILQMRSLLREMDEFPLSSFCPHGRPVSVEFSFARLEKEFGRTV